MAVSMRIRALVAASAMGLAGCAVGPDYRRPPDVAPAAYLSRAPQSPPGTPFAIGKDPLPDWWTALGSPALDETVAHALRLNPGLLAAEAAAGQARELALAQRGALFPSAQASFSSGRQRSPDVLAPPLASNATEFTLHTAQVSISYLFDVFGLERRTLESAEAQAEAARHQRDAAALTLAGNVITAAVQAASLREQLDATREAVEIAQDQLRLTRRQFELGAIPRLAVVAQEAALAQVLALVPPLERQYEQQRHALSALMGESPDHPPPEFRLAELKLPGELPVSIPSRLLERRPDILAAEAAVRAANAQVGVALAGMLPQFSINAAWGREGTRLGSLPDPSNALWSLAAGIVQPLFQGGALLHRKRAAEQGLVQAARQYRVVALNAFQGVADSLSAVEIDARALAASEEASRAAREVVAMTQKQLELGDVNYPVLLAARQSLMQAETQRIQAEAARLADIVALFLAVAGSVGEDVK